MNIKKISDGINSIKKIRDSINKYGNGHLIYEIFILISEKLIFDMPLVYTFNFGLLKKNYNERRTYLSNRSKEHLESFNCKDVSILVDKKKFNHNFSEFLGREYLFVKDASFDEFKIFIKKHPTYMEKANWACSGIGISKKSIEEKTDLKQLYNYYCENYILLEEVLVQHPDMNKLNSSSVNTVRVATVFAENKVNIVAAELRMGAGSVTDNLHNGGICCAVDIETGIVKSLGYNSNNDIFIKHPVSNVIIPGFQIPDWNSVIATTKKAAEKIPQFVWVGWDIAITNNRAIIIEGNHNQGIDLIQIGNKGLKPEISKLLKTRIK